MLLQLATIGTMGEKSINDPTLGKPGVAHLESKPVDMDDGNVKGYDSYGLVKSTFDDLSIPRTLWVFRRVSLISLAVYTGYVCEGFEVSQYLVF